MEIPKHPPEITRRRFVAGLSALAVAALAGCSGDQPQPEVAQTSLEPGIPDAAADTSSPTVSDSSSALSGGERVRGIYVPTWIDYTTVATDVPADSFNRLLVSFAEPRNNSQIEFDQGNGSYADFIGRTATQAAVISLSVGGWGEAHEHDDILASFKHFSAEPNRFADLVAERMQTVAAHIGRRVNAIDIDWEYPETPDDINTLLAGLRAVVPSDTQLSIAVPSWDHPAYFGNQAIDELADYFKLMSYDYDLGEQIIDGSIAPMDEVMNSVRLWSGEVPVHKLVVGLPNHAHFFRGAKGLGSAAHAVTELQYPELDQAKVAAIPLSDSDPGYVSTEGWVSVAPVQHLETIVQSASAEQPNLGGYFYWSAAGITAEHAQLIQ